MALQCSSSLSRASTCQVTWNDAAVIEQARHLLLGNRGTRTDKSKNHRGKEADVYPADSLRPRVIEWQPREVKKWPQGSRLRRAALLANTRGNRSSDLCTSPPRRGSQLENLQTKSSNFSLPITGKQLLWGSLKRRAGSDRTFSSAYEDVVIRWCRCCRRLWLLSINPGAALPAQTSTKNQN